MKAIYHFRKVDNDKNGNPRYAFNVFVNPGTMTERTLRVNNPQLGKFIKKYDAYVITYHGNDAQVALVIESLMHKAGLEKGWIV